jgi:ActR/RegA family two-component response regulator
MEIAAFVIVVTVISTIATLVGVALSGATFDLSRPDMTDRIANVGAEAHMGGLL